ncbi:MarR family transcriptional regulator [Streptomyces arenae]|nr:MarR family transcriptional regulator [Streptomyces arenae]
MRSSRILQQHADTVMRPRGLSFPQLQVLVLLSLSPRGALTMSQIGERLMVHPSTVTHTVSRLAGDGLLARCLNPDDARSTLAVITPSGRHHAEGAVQELRRTQFGLSCYRRGEQESIVRLLEPLRAAAQAVASSADESART